MSGPLSSLLLWRSRRELLLLLLHHEIRKVRKAAPDRLHHSRCSAAKQFKRSKAMSHGEEAPSLQQQALRLHRLRRPRFVQQSKS